MKKIFLTLFLLLVFASFASAATAPIWRADIAPLCEGVCLEGATANWQIQIQNLGEVPLNLGQVGLVDSDGFTFAAIDLSNQESVVPVGESGTLTLTGVIPPPTRASTLFYKINYVVGNNVFPDSNYRRMTVMPLTEVECTSNDFCSGDNICFAYRCTPYSMFNESIVPKPNQDKGMNHDVIQTILLALLLLVIVVVIVTHHSTCKRKKK